jgi:AcrR family transcriptional regulator
MARKVTSPRRRGRPPAAAGDDVRERLLDVATRLFVERGYAETGVREIARAAHAGDDRHYFGDKIGRGDVYRCSMADRRAQPPPRTRQDLDPIDALAVGAPSRALIPQSILREAPRARLNCGGHRAPAAPRRGRLGLLRARVAAGHGKTSIRCSRLSRSRASVPFLRRSFCMGPA